MSEDLRGDLSGLPPEGRVIVGFSGGADSTALSHWLTTRIDPSRLVLAHVNHMLRGEEADRDEAAARAFAQGLGLRFAVSRQNVGALAREKGMSCEECGRTVRYEFFLSLAPGENDRILTAHTQNDNGETMLLNLCRGAGLSGLCGIPYRRGKVLRPLLGVSREEVEAYCASHGLSYVRDSSNLSGEYSRNRIRLEVLPVLRELNPRAVEAMARTAALLSRDREFLEEEARKLLKLARREYGIDVKALRDAPEPLRLRALKLWLESLGCRDLEQKHLELADACLREGGAVSLPGRVHIRRGAGMLSGGLEKKGEKPFSIPVSLPAGWEGEPQKIALPGGKTLILEKKAPNLGKSTQKIHNLDFKNDLDYAIITGNLTARTRREGDRFSPAGRKHSKPLKQVFQEAGIPADRRGSSLLLECGGRLAFCEGVGAAEEFRVTEKTAEVLRVTIRACGETEKEG